MFDSGNILNSDWLAYWSLLSARTTQILRIEVEVLQVQLTFFEQEFEGISHLHPGFIAVLAFLIYKKSNY
jgi:hypothetical protein